MVRIVAIWAFGTLAAGTAGAMIGENLGNKWWLYGLVAGVAGFACARLWAAAPRGFPHPQS